MRGTLHLHTADDLIGIRALVEPFLQAQWKSNFLQALRRQRPREGHRRRTKAARQGADDRRATSARRCNEKFPGGEPLALSTLLQLSDILVQIPPTRIWGNNSRADADARRRTGCPRRTSAPLSRADLVRRYLAAYGPASVADMQTWSRLTRLGAEFEALRDELVTFEDDDGRTLYDFPDAPRPDADTPAPVRFLPLYDNVYLGYDNRRRMLSEETAQRHQHVPRTSSRRC